MIFDMAEILLNKSELGNYSAFSPYNIFISEMIMNSVVN